MGKRYQITKLTKQDDDLLQKKAQQAILQRSLQMKVSTTQPEDLGMHNASTQSNDSQSVWDEMSPEPVTPSSPSGPLLVEKENLPQNSAADQLNRTWLSATSDHCQWGGNQGISRAVPQPWAAHGNYTDFVLEHGVKNAGAHHGAHFPGHAATAGTGVTPFRPWNSAIQVDNVFCSIYRGLIP